MSAHVDSSGGQTARPVASFERVQIIDSLRGLALLGILLVNIQLFSNPIQAAAWSAEAAPAFGDRVSGWVVRFLAQGKFYSLFSLLFGVGLTIQMRRAERKGVSFVPLYLRRLVVLAAIGLAHALFLWTGDILTLYAVLGFALIPYRKARPRTLLIWAASLLSVSILINVFSLALLEIGGSGLAQHTDHILSQQEAQARVEAERARQVYSTGGLAEITAQRAHDLYFMAFANLSISPNVFAMFLIGVYFGRRQIFQRVDENLSLLRKLAWGGLAIGVPCNLAFAELGGSASPTGPWAALLAAKIAETIGGAAFCLSYLAALLLVARRAGWQKRVGLLAPTGQMALSNYLLQSVTCTLIFYGYGLGLFGKVGTGAGVLLALGVFLGQVVLSSWWMQRCSIGPAEWVWRSLTYLQMQPMVKRRAFADQLGDLPR